MQSSGVPLIDQVLGGLTPGLPLVLVGPSGSGRTVIALQLLASGVARGESAVILSGEPPPLLLRQAAALDLSLEDAVADGRLAVLELHPAVATALRVHGGERLAAAVLEEAPRPSLVVVDPISALTHEILDEASLRTLLRTIFEIPSANGGFVVACVDSARLREDTFLAQALADLCGSLIRLERSSDGRRSLSVEKCRAGTPTAGVVAVEIGPGGMQVAAETTAVETVPAGRARPRRVRPRILVIDPDASQRDKLALGLGDRYELSHADDGYEGLSAVLSEQPDLILLEPVLSRISGYEMLHTLRSSGSNIPVLVTSGCLGRTSDRVRALILGAADCLSKPLNPVELRHKVETQLALPEGPPRPPGADDVAKLLSEGTGHRVLGEGAFNDRLGRALRFGIEFGFESCVVAAVMPSEEALDALVASADERLRSEDAVLPLPDHRALILLVLTPMANVSTVLERLEGGLSQRGVPSDACRLACAPADAVAQLPDWKALFDSARPWSEGVPG